MNIGKRIRELRKNKKLTLVEISKKGGVALATLSRIETGKMTGTLNSHINIAKALDITLPELYSEINKPATLHKKKDYDVEFFTHNKKISSILLTKDIFTKKMLPVLIRLDRGAKTHKEGLRKGTEKFISVLDGKIEVITGKERNVLEKGTTLYFDAYQPHYIRNIGNTKARCLCVTTPAFL